MKTLFLDTVSWDLVADVNGNIAVADGPYALAQDAASAIKLFQGELFFDTTLGVPWFQTTLGHLPPIAVLKSQLANAALRVPGVMAAAVFITSIKDRRLSGQVQVTDTSGNITAAEF